jgi:hypothetical protein
LKTDLLVYAATNWVWQLALTMCVTSSSSSYVCD